MKTRNLTKIGKQLLPQLPGFVVEGKLIFKPPIGDFLCGIYFENASGTTEFYVRALFLPLFVPHNHIAFWCDRIRRNGRELWNANDADLVANLHETIQAEVIPFLNRVSTLDGALNYLRSEVLRTIPRVNSHTLEGFAYTLIKAGNYSAALKSLSELKQMLNGDSPPWIIEQSNRASLIGKKLSAKPDAALDQLEAWKTESISKLGLEKHCDRSAAQLSSAAS